MCVKPISLMYSSFECSDNVGMDLVTRNMVLMISCDEYPKSLFWCQHLIFSRMKSSLICSALPEFLQCINSTVDLAFVTRLDHRLHLDRVRTVNDSKYIVAADKAEASPGAL